MNVPWTILTLLVIMLGFSWDKERDKTMFNPSGLDNLLKAYNENPRTLVWAVGIFSALATAIILAFLF